MYHKGRGAQINTDNKFLTQSFEGDPDFLDHLVRSGEEVGKVKTDYIMVHPKTLVNKVTSPDLGFQYSMNPYQGCEHGCIYCYARNTHEYWGYSAGMDFETKILVKHNAPSLLEKRFESRAWKPTPIMLSGNTDCYQPAERTFRLTRSLLKICLECKNPVGIITKNAMILRDLDILKEMSRQNLIHVVFSITSLKEKTRRLLEPRTAAVAAKLNAIRKLSECGIPVSVMMAPLIPAINTQEIAKVAEAVSKNGALSLHYTIIRLNGIIPIIFEDWIRKNFPDRADKVLNQIKELHGGSLNDSRFGTRMKGEGELSLLLNKLFKNAIKKHDLNQVKVELRTDLFRKPSQKQLQLF